MTEILKNCKNVELLPLPLFMKIELEDIKNYTKKLFDVKIKNSNYYFVKFGHHLK